MNSRNIHFFLNGFYAEERSMKILKAAFVSLFCLMLIGGVALLVHKEPEAPTDGYFTYTVADGKVTIKGCDKTVSGELVVPSVLGIYPVTTIGS